MVVALGHQFPNYTYGANVGVHDLRMYVGPALSDAQVRPPPLGHRQSLQRRKGNGASRVRDRGSDTNSNAQNRSRGMCIKCRLEPKALA
jgi:hypothetical protein